MADEAVRHFGLELRNSVETDWPPRMASLIDHSFLGSMPTCLAIVISDISQSGDIEATS
jgi:hypothetical protein